MNNLSTNASPSTSGEINCEAPGFCSFIESPETAIQYFRTAKEAFLLGKGVHYDLSATTVFSEPSVAILIAQIKDRNINKGRITRVTFPKDATCKKSIQKFSILKKLDTEIQKISDQDIPVKKITNLQVANETAKQITKLASRQVYGEELRIKELYSTLIECMANTNNHASPDQKTKYKWMLFTYLNESENTVGFIFLDLGLGIFESLPVKQYITRNPYPAISLKGEVARYNRGMQLEEIFSAIAEGKIKSSTGLRSRGKGLPLIIQNAQSGHFKNFFIISNDAYVNVTNNTVAAMNENFQGTLIFFEFAEKRGTLI